MPEPWVLLVEDTRDGVTLTRHALRKAGIHSEVRVARSGREAFELLYGPPDALAPPEPPGLVLLDLKLPGINGLDVLTRIRSEEHTRIVPVVILTSSQEPSEIMASYAMGANSYVRKPVNFERFVEVVGQVSAYWLGMNSMPPQHPAIVPPSDAGPRSDDDTPVQA